MQLKTEYGKIDPYITKRRFNNRELMHPAIHGNGQSLAEATVPAGGQTMLHKHAVAEEIYHITEGCGIMTSAGRSLKSVKEIPSVFYPNSAQDNEHR